MVNTLFSPPSFLFLFLYLSRFFIILSLSPSLKHTHTLSLSLTRLVLVNIVCRGREIACLAVALGPLVLLT